MDNRYEIAEQNGMSREFAYWFFDNKKAGCGNVWFLMMAAMWEGWQGRAAMLQVGTFRENANSSTKSFREISKTSTNSPVIPEGYVMVPKEPTEAMMLHNSGCQHHAWDDPDCAMRQTRRLIWSHMLTAALREVEL